MEWLLAFTATGLFTITEVYSSTVLVGIALLALFFALRTINRRLWPERSGLEIPAILFVGSAVVATVISYNQSGALLQFSRIMAGLALFTLIVPSSLPEQRWLAVGFTLAALVLAVYWPLQNDFTAQPVKFEAIHAAGLWIEEHLPDFKLESLTGSSIHPAVAAGVLLLALPAAIALTLDAWHCKHRVLSVLAWVSTLIILTTLLLTSNRGAWLALAAMIGLGLSIAIQRRWFFTSRRKFAFWSTLVGLGFLSILYITLSGRLSGLLGAIPDPTGTVMARSNLWKQGIALISSYPFTGSGLASFYWVHSTYGLLIHVPFIQHAHNTFIQVWFEQGILGALAVLWASGVVFSKTWHALDKSENLLHEPTGLWGWAGLFMLAGNAAQGLVDVTMYIERTLPLYGLALGYAWLTFQREEQRPRPPKLQLVLKLAAGGAALLMVIVGIIYRAPLLGAWHANLGALSQARLELNYYNPNNFSSLTLDQVRQTLDLSQAEAQFQQALEWQPDQRTALQRLSEIALSRGEYQAALDWTQTAWNAFHRDDVTRLLYGDALVANGQPEKASQVVQDLYWAERRLMFQAYYRYFVNQDYRRALYAWQTVKLINPDNSKMNRLMSEIEQKLEQTP